MLSAQQPSSITSSPRSPQNILQHLKSSFSIPDNSSQPYSHPESPIHPSPRKIINPSPMGQALSSFSNSGLLLPLRMRTENNDNQRPDLFNMRSHTEASDSEEYLNGPTEKNGETKEQTFNRNIQSLVDDIKNRKKAQSAKKTYTCSSPASKSAGLWSKENIDASMPVTEKDGNGLQKKYRSSVEKASRSTVVELKFKSEKKEVKPSLADLDVEMGIDENLQEDGVEGLFDEGYMDKERLIKELGPIRYSKMSEEDAATIFEIRRKEVLSFLKKLGSSSVARKKSCKYPPLIRSSITSNNGQNSESEKIDFPSGKALRCLQDSIKDNASPTRFIIYNTANESLWNNTHNNSQTNKCVTPAKEKKLALSMRIGCESAPDGRRRDSSKIFKEREESNPIVERNLEANFNQLFEWNDAAEKRSPIKAVRKAEPAMLSYDDRNDDTENVITIDLTKASRLKKKKAAKRNRDKQEKSSSSSSQRIVISKQLSEDIRLSPLWEQQEIQVENKASQKAIEELRKKNQAVMNDIDDIDDQIQRMRDSYSHQTQSQKKPVHNREEPHKIVIEENLDSYSLAAKMKKNSERSRSLSLKLGFRENLKQNENLSGSKCRPGQNSRGTSSTIIVEEPGSQTRRGERSRVSENMEEIRRSNAPTPIKLTNEKIMISTPVQANTLKFDLKQNQTKTNGRNTPVIKQALPKNASGSKSGLQDVNLNLHKTKEVETIKDNSSLKQGPNSRTSPPTVNRILEKTKPNNKSLGLYRISKTSETTSTLQTVREHLLTSPKETAFTLRRTNSKLKSESLYKREPSSCSISSNKTLNQPQKPSNKSLSIKINQKAVSDKYMAEGTQIPNLFESNSDASMREPSTPAPKIPLSKETKLSSHETSQEKTPVVSAAKQKPVVKNSEPFRTVKNAPTPVKKVETNRPNFDTNSSAGIRAKIFRRQNQESSAFIKPILSPKNFSNTSRLDSSQVTPHGVPSSSVDKSGELALKSSGNIQETLRKGSLSTPRGFKLLSSPVSQGSCVAQSLQDLRDKLSGNQGTGVSPGDIESLESFRLREKSLNLPLRPVSLSQAETTKTNEAKKSTQTFKRKPTTGYSLC